MECELNGKKLKYEGCKIWAWREKQGNRILKVPKWVEMKGTINKYGYRVVKINNRHFYSHRIIYYLHNPQWDIHDSSMSNFIDHIDRNPFNNSIENLRVVSHSQNMWNQDRKGYSFNKQEGKYLAKIRVDGKQKYLGYFTNEQDARDSYLKAKREYHSI